jgi:predicted ATPase/class 3 adenylate cyclase
MGEIFSFGVWVRRRRKALDLTQDVLARRVGCALSMIRKIEADERKPSRQIAALLASALEVPAAEREQFLQAARAELAVDQLAAPKATAAPEPPLVTLPTGTVTFLFTDIAGSTRLWEQHPTAMQTALARHDGILRDAIAAHGGTLVKGTGDGLHAAFARATDAVHAALAAQRALQAEPWDAFAYADSPQSKTQNPKSKIELRVRMALHIGVSDERNGDYFGPAVNRAARLLAVGHGGQILLSHAMCDVVRDHLPPGAALHDLGAHRLKDLSRKEQISQLTVADLPADFPPLASLSERRHNLPTQLTSFVGRENELAAITRLLDGTHLLTLTGPGGTGKTRLSLQVAAELILTPNPSPMAMGEGSKTPAPPRVPQRERGSGGEGRFPDGAWLVELAPLADPALVPQAVASALDLREDAGRPLLNTLTDFLRGKDLLLIIDNCEHVVDACAQLAETVLRACPRVRILASSREALGIAGEVAWRVPSLATPDPRRLPPIETLTQYEGVRLFVERAAAVLPGFTVTNANAPAIAQVCARLDGIPLALELAAARVNVLRVEQIAARLDDRFRLLTGGSRGAVPRQQTLRALIDWSYDLLAESERLLLQRLAGFAGGWALEAAEAVCAGGSLNQDDVLGVLTQLVNKSLVVAEREQSQETRYRLLETIRQYALERLAASGEADAVRRRHADYYVALAEAAEPHLRSREQGAWLDRLEVEHDNLRAALGWALAGGDLETGARIAIALAGPDWLGGFWNVPGYWNEGLRWLEAVLAQRDALSPGHRARALLLVAFYQGALHGGPWERLFAAHDEALALFRAAGDRSGIALVRFGQGLRTRSDRDYARGMPLLEEALARYQELGDHYHIQAVLHVMGDIERDHGDAARGVALLEQSLALCRQRGYDDETSGVLNGLGDVACNQGDLPRATTLYWEALLLVQDERYSFKSIWPLRNLGRLALVHGDDGRVRALLQQHVGWFREKAALSGLISLIHVLGAVVNAQGDTEQGIAILRDGLILQQQAGQQEEMIESLEAFAEVAIGQSRAVRAARLLGAAEALRITIGAQRESAACRAYERDVAAARAQLGEAAFAAAWAEGRMMTLADAVAEALAETQSND